MEGEKSTQDAHLFSEIIRNLSFCLLQEELTPCYAELSGATVLQFLAFQQQ